MSMLPMAMVGRSSETGTKDAARLVAFSLFHTPPSAAVKYTMSGFVGWIAIPVRRPPMLAGPTFTQEAEALCPCLLSATGGW